MSQEIKEIKEIKEINPTETTVTNLDTNESSVWKFLNKIQIPFKIAVDKLKYIINPEKTKEKYKDSIDELIEKQMNNISFCDDEALTEEIIEIGEIDHNEIIKSVMYENMIKKNKKRLFEESTYEKTKALMFSEPTLVAPRIYLGNSFNACDYYGLKKLNIKKIINATYDIRNYYPDDFIYVRVPIEDDNKESICKYLKYAYKEIDDFLMENEDGNILVHCMMGASRSVTIVSYYIAMKTKQNIKDIIENLKKIRPIINPTQKLVDDLVTELK